MVTHTVDKLGLNWEVDAVQNQSLSKLDDRFLISRAPAHPYKPLPFFPTSTRRFRGPGSRHFQHVSQMQRPRISPPLLTWRVVTMQRCRWWKRLWLNFSRRTRTRLGSLTLSSRRSHVESRRASSGNLTRLQASRRPHYTMTVLQAYQAKLLKELDEGEGMTRLRRKEGVRLPSRGRVRHEMLSQSLFEKSLSSGFIFAFTTFNDKINEVLIRKLGRSEPI